MSTRLALSLGLALGLSACATAPKVLERPLVVQLAVSGSQGECDWSLRQEPDYQPDKASLGSIYWPRLVPRPPRERGPRTQPLLAYGSTSATYWTATRRNICLTLHRRHTIFIEGIPPVVVIDIAPNETGAKITTRASDPSITRIVLQLTTPTQAPQTFDFDLSQGQDEANFAPPPPGAWTVFRLMAVERGGEAQAARALNLLQEAPKGRNLVKLEGRRLVITQD